MRSSTGFRVLTCLLPLVVLLGCGGEGKNADEGPAKQPGEINADELPPLATYTDGDGQTQVEYLPRMLDDERLKVAPPAGWKATGLKGYEVLLKPEDSPGRFPCILIEAEDYEEKFFKATKDNVREFVKHVQARLADEGKASVKVEPRIIGDFAGAFYGYVVRVNQSERDRVFLETVSDGRKYSLQLHAVKGDAEDYIDYLYSVAAGIKFVKEKPEEPEAKPEEPEAKPEEPEAKPEEPEAKPEQKDDKDKPSEKGKETEKDKQKAEEKAGEEDKESRES